MHVYFARFLFLTLPAFLATEYNRNPASTFAFSDYGPSDLGCTDGGEAGSKGFTLFFIDYPGLYPYILPLEIQSFPLQPSHWREKFSK